MAKQGATIHEVGYRRYQGKRTVQGARRWVVVRNFIAMAWPGWWRSKAWLSGAAATTIALGAVLYILQGDTFSNLVRFATGGDVEVSIADGIVPFGYRAFLFPMLAFILSMTVVAPAIARDLGVGAFEFYFARPLRPIDYVVGKVAGAVLLLSLVLLAGPFLLALFRLGLSDTSGDLADSLHLVPKTLTVGVMATLAFATVPLAISSLSGKATIAAVIWAALYFVVGGVFQLLAMTTQSPALAAFDIKSAVLGLSFGLFDFGFRGPQVIPPAKLSAIALSIYIGVSVFIIYWRVARAERAGLGGG